MEFYYQPVGQRPRSGRLADRRRRVPRSPGYLRSLSNPDAKGHPDHYSLRRFIGTNTDDGGVHFNLTIGTHAFYLAVAGGRNRVSGITVPGVGLGNIERMERDLLPRVHAADGAELAVLRRAARHAAGGVGPLRRRQQRTSAGRARLDRRGGELMRVVARVASAVLCLLLSLCCQSRRGPGAVSHFRQRRDSRRRPRPCHKSSRSIGTSNRDRSPSSATIPKAVIYDFGAAVRLWRGLYAGGAVSMFDKTGAGTVTARVPHPLQFNKPRTTTGEIADADAPRDRTAHHVRLGDSGSRRTRFPALRRAVDLHDASSCSSSSLDSVARQGGLPVRRAGVPARGHGDAARERDRATTPAST